MVRVPDVYIYRGPDDTGLQLDMHPIKTTFFSEQNLTHLKMEADKRNANISKQRLIELMEEAYLSNDVVHKNELSMYGKGSSAISPYVEGLNRFVVRKMVSLADPTGQEFHNVYLQGAKLFLAGDVTDRFKMIKDQVPLYQFDRGYYRDSAEIDTIRKL